MRDRILGLASIGAVSVVANFSATPARAGFLDVDRVIDSSMGTPASNFNGSLDGIPVIGTTPINFGPINFRFTGTGTGHANSTTDATSPQYSYGAVYSPAAALADRVGVVADPGVISQFTITFGAPVTNVRFHVAELDGTAYAFDLTGGLTGLSLVSGNGGNGDGLQVVGNKVSDINPATGGGRGNTSLFGLPPTMQPPTTGDRPAYGTVSLNGTYTSLTINVTSIGDGGSFTLSSVPEPTATATVGVAGLALLRRRWTA